MSDLTIFNNFTRDELLDANERARRHVGKRLELCTHDDLEAIRAAIRDEITVLEIERATVQASIDSVLDGARRRSEKGGA